jgi:hypothetical protein
MELNLYNTNNIKNISQPSSCNSFSEPQPMNIRTPTTSESEGYNWTVREREILDKWQNYATDLAVYLSWLERDGPKTDKVMPKKPREGLQSLLGKPKAIPLMGVNLHEYLLKHIGDSNVVNVRPWEPTSLENVKNTLIDGFKILEQHNAKLLSHYLHYGQILNDAFNYFSISKLRGHFSGNWKDWLEKNIGISNSYAKQLRSLAENFGQHLRLHSLGISLNEFLKRKEDIRLMFFEFPELDTYWKQNPTQQ